jgi:hypothetical protein
MGPTAYLGTPHPFVTEHCGLYRLGVGLGLVNAGREPDAGHGSLFQFHKSFVTQASLFLESENIN